MGSLSTKEFYRFITSDDALEEGGIAEIVSPITKPDSWKLLKQVIDSLKDKNIQIVLRGENIYASSSLSSAEIKISSDDSGKLTQVNILPLNNEYARLEEVAERFAEQKIRYQIFFKKNDSTRYLYNTEKVAVSSLSKLYICDIIYKSVKKGLLDWGSQFILNAENIRNRSAGLSMKDVGSTQNIRSLVTYSLIASDNTATDILVNIIRDISYLDPEISQSINGVKSTAEAYGNLLDLNANHLNIGWPLGLDYFFDIPTVAKSMESICSNNWTPWDGLGELSRGVAYKGGQAPGVLSGMWLNHRKINKRAPKVLLGYSINSDKMLTYIDEICITASISSFFAQNANLTEKGI